MKNKQESSIYLAFLLLNVSSYVWTIYKPMRMPIARKYIILYTL